MTPLFKVGNFKLHSGDTSEWKVECDALTTEDWQGLARMAMEFLPPFREVVAIPRGGIPLKAAMDAYVTPDSSRLLVVDDVLTTGNSMYKTMFRYPSSIGLVAFARGPLPPNVYAIWQFGKVSGSLQPRHGL